MLIKCFKGIKLVFVSHEVFAMLRRWLRGVNGCILTRPEGEIRPSGER
jgi:hypothetical protein